MGDAKRFTVLASYITQRYPKWTKILDAAGGAGHLQIALNSKGYTNVITVDDRPARRRERDILYIRKYIQEVDEKANLIVGLHPDSATSWIIKKAYECKSDFIIVPCCSDPGVYNFPGGSFSSYVIHLEAVAQRLGFDIERYYLKIQGKNLLIHGKYRNKEAN